MGVDRAPAMPTGLREIGHAFVLNLDRRQDRLESFQEKARRAGLGAVERVAAVDGRHLTPTPEILHLFRGNDFGYRRGVVGCALSHLGLWKRIADSSWPHRWTLVFEDDVMFCGDFARLWNEAAAPWIPLDCELFYLGGLCVAPEHVEPLRSSGAVVGPRQWPYVADRVNHFFARPRDTGFGLYAYAVAPSAARLLCQAAELHGIEYPIDHFVSHHWPRLEAWVTVPLLCWGSEEGTDIQRSFDALV